MADVGREKNFCIPDTAAEAEDARGFPRPGELHDAADHVLAKGSDGGLGEVGLGETGVELFVILDFALKGVGHGRFSS